MKRLPSRVREPIPDPKNLPSRMREPLPGVKNTPSRTREPRFGTKCRTFALQAPLRGKNPTPLTPRPPLLREVLSVLRASAFRFRHPQNLLRPPGGNSLDSPQVFLAG